MKCYYSAKLLVLLEDTRAGNVRILYHGPKLRIPKRRSPDSLAQQKQYDKAMAQHGTPRYSTARHGTARHGAETQAARARSAQSTRTGRPPVALHGQAARIAFAIQHSTYNPQQVSIVNFTSNIIIYSMFLYSFLNSNNAWF